LSRFCTTVQRAAAQPQAVAVGHQLAAQVDPLGHAVVADPEQETGVALHDDQRPAVRGLGDAVGVVEGRVGALHPLAGQRHPHRLSRQAALAERQLEQHRVARVGEEGGAAGEHHVVDEGVRAGRLQLIGPQHRAGAGVDDPGVAARSAGDEQPPPVVDLQAERAGARAFADHPALTGLQADPVDVAVDARAEVRVRPVADGDALRLETVGQGEDGWPPDGGMRRGGGRGERRAEHGGDDNRKGASGHGKVLSRRTGLS
jgi:hypothetical protein